MKCPNCNDLMDEWRFGKYYCNKCKQLFILNNNYRLNPVGSSKKGD